MSNASKTYISALAFNLQTREGAAGFLAAAEDVEDWHLRVRYIASWNGNPEAITDELWSYIRNDDWVRTTAMVLGVTGEPTPGISIEKIEITTLPAGDQS